MKRVLLAGCVLALTLSWTARAQGKPDFSGTWTMDPTRSESAMQADPIGPVMLVITQTPSELKIATTRAQKTTTETYKLDGSESKIAGGSAKARWDGSTLVIDAVHDVQGASVTTKEARSLASNGNEMIVETVVEVQHGYSIKGAKNYSAGKDVYTRLRQ